MPDRNDRDKQFFLVVENRENWEIDRSNGFRVLGVSDRFYKTANKIREGDQILTYLTKDSAFVGLRTVEADGVVKADNPNRYDRTLEWEIRTRPDIELEDSAWIKAYSCLEEIDLTRGKANWGLIFLTAFRRISKADGCFLSDAIAKAAGK